MAARNVPYETKEKVIDIFNFIFVVLGCFMIKKAEAGRPLWTGNFEHLFRRFLSASELPHHDKAVEYPSVNNRDNRLGDGSGITNVRIDRAVEEIGSRKSYAPGKAPSTYLALGDSITSGQYWAVPCEGDALGWAYRKDLFEDSNNKAAFKAEYGYEIGVPKSWDMLRDVAEFFHDPDNGFYTPPGLLAGPGGNSRWGRTARRPRCTIIASPFYKIT